jgi:hypothetical protein
MLSDTAIFLPISEETGTGQQIKATAWSEWSVLYSEHKRMDPNKNQSDDQGGNKISGSVLHMQDMLV